MNEVEMPFINDTFKGLGTAPALESIELGDDVPVAINPHEISREATRYVFFAGDVIIPRQKRERSDLRLGGEYFGQEYKTLVRSKGLVRRCQITPLEIGFDFMGEEQIGDNATGLQVVSQIQHETPGAVLAPSKLNAVQTYPGEEIRGILRGDSAGTNKGFVELKQLAGIAYADFRQSGIQEFVFPEWTKILAGAADLPIKHKVLVAHLSSRRTETQDIDLRDVIDAMLVSCDKYFEWGQQYLKYSSMLVKVPAHQGFVHTYSDLAEMLFTQLDIRREDMLADAGTQEMFNRAQSGAVSGEDVKALLQMVQDNQAVIMQLMTGKAPKIKAIELEEVESIPKDEEPIVVHGQASPDPIKCSFIKADGEQCQREAKDDGRCVHPAHALSKE